MKKHNPMSFCAGLIGARMAAEEKVSSLFNIKSAVRGHSPIVRIKRNEDGEPIFYIERGPRRDT